MELLDTLLTSDNIAYTAFGIVALIVAFMIIRKVASCLIRIVVFAILVAILGYIYLNYNQESEAPSLEVETTE